MAFEVFDDVAFYWFLVSVLIVFLVPATCIAVNRYLRVQESHRVDWTVGMASCAGKNATLSKRKQRDRMNNLFSVQSLLFWGGWLVFAYLLTQITAKQGLEMASFDPFKILEIENDAEPGEVKKAYRRLSLIFHPDKNPGDKEAEQKFILIAKAYEVLTDEKTRENYEKYGNPDGYHGTSVTIGLPSFLTAKENELGILVVYFVVLIIVIPLVVGLWWRKSQKYLEDGIMQRTAFRFYRQLQENTAPKYLPGILASANEFQESVPPRNAQAAELERLHKAVSDQFVKNQGDHVPEILKVKTLLYAHLLRESVPVSLREDLRVVLEGCPVLLQGLLNLSIDQRFVTSTINILDFWQLLTQGLWFHDSSLRMLPHLSDKHLRALGRSRHAITSVAQLKGLPEDTLAEVLPDLSEAERAEVALVLKNMPDVDVDVKFEVEDEEGIYENDVINLVVRVDRKHYPDDYTRMADDDEKNDPILNQQELTDEEIEAALEGNEDEEKREEKKEELLERDRELWFAKQERRRELARARARGGVGWFKMGAPPRVVHAPRFPGEVHEQWHVLLVDTKTNRLIHSAKLATNNAVESVTLKFVAPKEGVYAYEVHVKNTSYVGVDKKAPFKIQIDKRPEEVIHAETAAAEEEDDEEEEEEEEEGKWYYLGGNSFGEFILNVIALFIAGVMLFNFLYSKGWWQKVCQPLLDWLLKVASPLLNVLGAVLWPAWQWWASNVYDFRHFEFLFENNMTLANQTIQGAHLNASDATGVSEKVRDMGQNPFEEQLDPFGVPLSESALHDET